MRLVYGQRPRVSGHRDILDPDELGLQYRFTVLQQHGDDLA